MLKQGTFGNSSRTLRACSRFIRPLYPCNLFLLQQCRGAKSQSRKKVAELPQGALQPLEDFVEKKKRSSGEDDFPLSPLLAQTLENQQRFPNCILLTKVGQFYEELTATEIAPILNLKLASKSTKAGTIAFAGFPVFQLDRYLKILVEENGRYVAMCEEFKKRDLDDLSSTNIFERKITRIITPGTLIDERFINPYQHNFLLAIAISQNAVGLAWLDLSTGDFFTQQSHIGSLNSDISRIGPREILLSEDLRSNPANAIFEAIEEEQHFITYEPFSRQFDSIGSWIEMLEAPPSEEITNQMSPSEVEAGSALLGYVKDKLQGLCMKLQPPIRRNHKDTMLIDTSSLRALELKKNLREGTSKGSVLHAIKKTVTTGGARMLNDWLTSPITNMSLINQRLDLVETFLLDASLRQDIIHFLRCSHDSQRVVQKFSLGKGDADDYLALARTINATEEIRKRLELETGNNNLRSLIERIKVPLELSRKIKNSIDEDALSQKQRMEEEKQAKLMELLNHSAPETEPENVKTCKMKKGKKYDVKDDVWIMKKDATTLLKKLHADLIKLAEDKEILEETLQETSNAPTLTLRWTPGLGHIVHVREKDMKTISSIKDAKSVSSSRSTRSFQIPDWTFLGSKIDQLKIMIRAEETKTFERLRHEVIKRLVILRRNARVLDELDVVCSFATLAQERRLVRPILNYGTSHKIISGRHPIVEAGLAEKGLMFTSNDCTLEDSHHRIWLLTGPNMGGKSTFLRQNAVISILAQMGSYVPAEYAEIGIVDQVFSRIGSADNLFRDQSTFMVEMMETASILKNATPRSFVIMDEIGRGTSSREGIALAFAALHHLYHVNKCRALFATHYHEIAHLAAKMPQIGTFCTDVLQGEDGSFTFLHKVGPGVNVESHAFKVAELAGMPKMAIETAHSVLQVFEHQSLPAATSSLLSANAHL